MVLLSNGSTDYTNSDSRGQCAGRQLKTEVCLASKTYYLTLTMKWGKGAPRYVKCYQSVLSSTLFVKSEPKKGAGVPCVI